MRRCVPYDSNYKMKPPLRSACDTAAVVDGIVSGAVDAIATDHAPHPGSEKMQEFEKCPFGIIGLETALGLALEHLVHTGKISLAAAGGAVHHRSRARIASGSRDAGRGRCGRRDHLQHRSGVDLRREPVLLQEPQLAV